MVVGIIYQNPPRTSKDVKSYEDLTVEELNKFNLKNLPVYIEHDTNEKSKVGRIVDHYEDDGKYIIEFEYFKNIKGGLAKHLVENGPFNQLSLGHVVYDDNTKEPREVSICIQGKRDGTYIIDKEPKFAPLSVNCSASNRNNQQKYNSIYNIEKMRYISNSNMSELDTLKKKFNDLQKEINDYSSGKSKSEERGGNKNNMKKKKSTSLDDADLTRIVNYINKMKKKRKRSESDSDDDDDNNYNISKGNSNDDRSKNEESNRNKRKKTNDEGSFSNIDKNTTEKFRELATYVNEMNIPEEYKQTMYDKIGNALNSTTEYHNKVANEQLEEGKKLASSVISTILDDNVIDEVSNERLKKDVPDMLGKAFSQMPGETKGILREVLASKHARRKYESEGFSKLMARLKTDNYETNDLETKKEGANRRWERQSIEASNTSRKKTDGVSMIFNALKDATD